MSIDRKTIKRARNREDTDFNVETQTGKNHMESTNSKTNHYDDEGIQQYNLRQQPRDLLRQQTVVELHTLTLTLSLSHTLTHLQSV